MKYFIIFLLLYNSLFAAEIKIEVFGKQNLEKLRFSSPKDCEEIESRISPTSKHFIGKSNPSFCSDYETPKFLTYRSLESTYFYEKVVKIDEYDSSCDLTKESNYFDLCVYSSSCPAGTIPTDKEPYCECPDGEIWNDDMTACHPATCDDLGDYYMSQCDSKKNNFKFQCDDSNPDGPPVFTQSCTPRPKCSELDPDDYIPNGETWEYIYADDEQQCTSKLNPDKYTSNYFYRPFIIDCPDTGFCYLKLKPDNNSSNGDGDNNSSNGDGDSNSSNGSGNNSNIPFDEVIKRLDLSNTSLKDIDNLIQKQSDNFNDFKNKNLSKIDITNSSLKDIDNTLNTTNDKLDSTNRKLADANDKLDTTNKKLSGVNDKLDITNSKLSDLQSGIGLANDKLADIKDALTDTIDTPGLEEVDTIVSERATFITKITDQYSEFGTNITVQMGDLSLLYDNARSMYQEGFNFTKLSSSGASDGSCFSAVVFNRKIEFKLCPYLQVFKPIFYFVLMVIFMFHSIKITMNYMMKG